MILLHCLRTKSAAWLLGLGLFTTLAPRPSLAQTTTSPPSASAATAQPAAPTSSAAPRAVTEDTPRDAPSEPQPATEAASPPASDEVAPRPVPPPSPPPVAPAVPTPVAAPAPEPAPPPLPAREAPLADGAQEKPHLTILKQPARVEFGRVLVYEIRVGSKSQSAEARARAAQKALSEVILTESPGSVRVVQNGDAAVIYAGQSPILQLFSEDAEAAGDSSLAVHADGVAMHLRKLLEAEQRRKTLATNVFSVSLAVLMSLVALYLLRRTSELGDRARVWVEKHRDKIAAVKVQSFELVGPAAMRSSAILGVEVTRWLARFGIVYLWLLVTLSQFAVTRGYVQKLTATFVEPLTDMIERTALTLPLLGVALLALAAIWVLVRFVDLFFAAVARKETEVPWIPAELAEPTGVLLRLAIILLALLFVAPLVTGNADGVLPRSGMIGLAAIGLAAAPLLASLLVGIGVVFGRRLKIGDLVVLAGHRGRVRGVGLFTVRLDKGAGVEVRVPQLLSLLHPTELLGSSVRTHVELPVPALSREVRDALHRAALSVGTQPEVEVLRVDWQGAVYKLGVLSDRVDARSALFLAAADELRPLGVDLGPARGAAS